MHKSKGQCIDRIVQMSWITASFSVPVGSISFLSSLPNFMSYLLMNGQPKPKTSRH